MAAIEERGSPGEQLCCYCSERHMPPREDNGLLFMLGYHDAANLLWETYGILLL